jgi:hypothetical protein
VILVQTGLRTRSDENAIKLVETLKSNLIQTSFVQANEQALLVSYSFEQVENVPANKLLKSPIHFQLQIPCPDE